LTSGAHAAEQRTPSAIGINIRLVIPAEYHLGNAFFLCSVLQAALVDVCVTHAELSNTY
jgi:hypothetical protein